MYFEDFEIGMVFKSEEESVQQVHLENFLEQDFVGGYRKVYEEYCTGHGKAFRGRPIIPGEMTSASMISFVLKSVGFSKPVIHKTTRSENFKWPVQLGDRLKAEIIVLGKDEACGLVDFQVVVINQDNKEVAKAVKGFRVEKKT